MIFPVSTLIITLKQNSFFPSLSCEEMYLRHCRDVSGISKLRTLQVFRSALFALLAAIGTASTVDKLVASFSASFGSWECGDSPKSDLTFLFAVTPSICIVWSEDT